MLLKTRTGTRHHVRSAFREATGCKLENDPYPTGPLHSLSHLYKKNGGSETTVSCTSIGHGLLITMFCINSLLVDDLLILIFDRLINFQKYRQNFFTIYLKILHELSKIKEVN